MYSLIIPGTHGTWDRNHYAIDVSRFLEQTLGDVAQPFRALDQAAIDQLMRLPCVFAFEADESEARVGWITEIRVRRPEIRIAVQFDQAIAPFRTRDIAAHVWEFDINRGETHRTHWAIKDVDLFTALQEAGLGGDMVRTAEMPVPPYAPQPEPRLEPEAPQLEIRPEVFRVPVEARNPRLVALMMPFDRAFQPVHTAITAACQAAGLLSQRVDNMWEDATVIQDVFNLIYRAEIVVVDFSGKNPNVFYETGIAHTLGRKVVPITQSEADVPFDLRHHRYLRYLPNQEGLLDLTAKLEPRLRHLAQA